MLIFIGMFRQLFEEVKEGGCHGPWVNKKSIHWYPTSALDGKYCRKAISKAGAVDPGDVFAVVKHKEMDGQYQVQVFRICY